MWTYNLASKQWTWVSGDNTSNPIGNWGALGVSNPNNIPSGRSGSVGWSDGQGNLYLFGGASTGFGFTFNDLWKFKIDTPYISCLQVVPVSNFISSDTTFCNEAGKCLSFYDQSINGPISWHWLFPGATPSSSTQQNPSNICYTQPGTYAVTLIVTNAAGSDTLTVSPMITVGTNPAAPVLTVSNDTIYCSHAASYQWYRNGNPIAGATDSFYVFTQTGTYAVQITDSIGCSRLSDGIVITGIQSSEFKVQRIRVYPNPAGDVMFIEGNIGANATVSIFNTLGEVALATTYYDKKVLSIKTLSAGIYFVRVTDNKGNYAAKFVKE